jgi:hypothetical protein
MQIPRAKSSWIQSSFDISTTLSLRFPPRIGLSAACKVLQVPSGEPHFTQVSPNLRLLPIFRTSLNHGAFLHPCPSGPPAFQLQHIQGWTRHFQGWPPPRPQLGPPPSPPARLGVLHCIHSLTLAISCLHLQHFKLCPGISTLVMWHLQGLISNPLEPHPPPTALELPAREPVAHLTRSHVPAPLALFASGCTYHEYF